MGRQLLKNVVRSKGVVVYNSSLIFWEKAGGLVHLFPVSLS